MKNKIILPLLTWFVISFSIIVTIYIKTGQEFNYLYCFRMFLFGSIGFIYTFSLNHFNLSKASLVFFVFSVLAGFFLYFKMPVNPIGFDDLAVFIGWLTILTIGLIVSLIYAGWLVYRRRK